MDDKSVITMFIEALRARGVYKILRWKAPVSYVAMMAKAKSTRRWWKQAGRKGGKKKAFKRSIKNLRLKRPPNDT